MDRTLAALVKPLKALRYNTRSKAFLQRGEHGLLFELYPNEEIDRQISLNGIYERRYLRFLESLILDGAVILDVGANIGNHALYLSRKASSVHCFEPNPRAYERLERNVALSQVTNVTVHRYGLGDRDETIRFAEVAGNLGMTRFSEAGNLELQIKRGDDVISMPTIDFIKIDAEGMEASVLAGLRDTIAVHRPIVAFEFNGEHWDRIIRALPGYQIFEPVFPKGLALLSKGETPELRPVGPEKRWYEGLIALPN